MKLALFLFIVILGSVACQKSDDGSHPGMPGLTAPNPLPGTGSGGTVDGGGEHGVDGRPLESFRTDIESIKEMKPLLDLIDNVSTVDRVFAGELLHILRQRSWNFVPVKLQDIPSWKIGAYFKTDQIAIHRLDDVYIDANLFEKMTADDKRLTILHEMVMGARFLEYKDKMDQCVADIRYLQLPLRNHADGGFQKAHRDCMRTYGLDLLNFRALPPRAIPVTDHDVSVIRQITALLYENEGKVDEEDLEHLLLDGGFRREAPKNPATEDPTKN